MLLSVRSRKVAQDASALRIPPVIIVEVRSHRGSRTALWLAYNGIVYRNPLEFANGPYSAKAIERRNQSAGNPGHPGTGNPLLAGMYFLKSAEDNLANNELAPAGMDSARGCERVSSSINSPAARRRRPTVFFACLNVAPSLARPRNFLRAFGRLRRRSNFRSAMVAALYYNVRYGLQLLPAFAVALAIVVHLAMRSITWNRRLRAVCVLAVCTLAIASYASILRATPVSLKEAQVNMRTRNQLETRLAVWLRDLPPDSTLLMYLGDHVGALQQAGIPLKRIINEGNHRVWKQP